MSGDEFNPNSIDAMFAKILANQEEMKTAVEKTNAVFFSKIEKLENRTTKIETAMAWVRGNAAAISLVVSGLAWVASHFIK